MLAYFDGRDEQRQVEEHTELRARHGMNYSAVPLAVQVGDEWQVWWRDTRAGTWFYRVAFGDVVQIPFDVVP